MCAKSAKAGVPRWFSLRATNSTWISVCITLRGSPLIFDGIKLMMHPSPSRTKALGKRRVGWSNAALCSKATRRRGGQLSLEPDEYVVFDVETTGLDVDKDEIIEIAAIKVINGDAAARFHALVKSGKHVPKTI